MSSSRPSGSRIWLKIGGGAVVLVAAAALLWPVYARNRAASLVSAGNGASGDEAQLDYRLANQLDGSNQVAAIKVTAVDLAAGKSQDALTVIGKALRSGSGFNRGQGSELLVLRAEAEVELSKLSAATADAKLVLGNSPTDDQIATVALIYAAAGQGSESIQALEGRVSSPEALQRIKHAESVNIALVDELAASGLPHSSSAILAKLPDSPPKELRLAERAAAGTTSADWNNAATHYAAYLAAFPTDIAARQAYVVILDKLGYTTDASTQQTLITSLKIGKP